MFYENYFEIPNDVLYYTYDNAATMTVSAQIRADRDQTIALKIRARKDITHQFPNLCYNDGNPHFIYDRNDLPGAEFVNLRDTMLSKQYNLYHYLEAIMYNNTEIDDWVLKYDSIDEIYSYSALVFNTLNQALISKYRTMLHKQGYYTTVVNWGNVYHLNIFWGLNPIEAMQYAMRDVLFNLLGPVYPYIDLFHVTGFLNVYGLNNLLWLQLIEDIPATLMQSEDINFQVSACSENAHYSVGKVVKGIDHAGINTLTLLIPKMTPEASLLSYYFSDLEYYKEVLNNVQYLTIQYQKDLQSVYISWNIKDPAVVSDLAIFYKPKPNGSVMYNDFEADLERLGYWIEDNYLYGQVYSGAYAQ